ncbi:ATP-binding protein [Sediminispirochaeta smaragdinae]|uniref:Uncharacterized protein n=1 Tax=Sediminispirochaeta smaragdinae (strain DSM 11293 / JCM 15392 / SEBR 4228) TaxID=573413 RepID=E1R205_SEDSS|nr:ATP-binding protein [Sediminispirochaeta smaragdinae]ADK81890.1 hypothetical protein Spirs_2787 [Sediminispirochaeta smaragdinae DSM 11293]
MTIEKTSQIKAGDNLVMVIYGKGGVGKTTFTATAPNVILLDFENGTKYLGARGFNVDVIRLKSWPANAEKQKLAALVAPYHTIALDPLGEAMEKLLNSSALNGRKFRQADGSLTMAGWGEAKAQMRSFIKWLRDSGKNVIIVAHVSEEKDGEMITNRIQVATKLREEIPNIVDVISYMGVKMVDDKPVRILYTPRQGDQFDSKDRTGRVPLTVQVSEHDGFNDLLKAMGIGQQNIPENKMPVPEATPTTFQGPQDEKQTEPTQKDPDEEARTQLKYQLDGAIVGELVTKAERDEVLANSKKYKGQVLEAYIQRISDELFNLQQKAESANSTVAPERQKEKEDQPQEEEEYAPEEPEPEELEIW